MKKIISISLIIILHFISIGSFAQQLPDDWRLTKKTWVHPGEGKLEWIYSYDATGKITAIKYYQNKKLHSTQRAFVYDSQNRISRYQESLTKGAPTEHLFSYDDKNRLLSVKEKMSRDNGKQDILTRTFSYTNNEIKESKSFNSARYGEQPASEITYELDGTGNMVRKTTIEDGEKIAQPENIFIYGEYDNKPNPLIFTGAYFYTELASKQNGKEGYSETLEKYKPAKTIFTYSPSGMLQNAAVTYMLDNRGYTHKFTYTYAKIKSALKPVVK
jgi:hypothetical protein